MEPIKEIIDKTYWEETLNSEDIPEIDLYMDQVLTLIDEGMKGNKRNPEDKIVTKTMINNYSKERLLNPLKGKKYSKEQILQILCVINLKQTISLADIQALMHQENDVDIRKVYDYFREESEKLSEQAAEFVSSKFLLDQDFTSGEKKLAFAMLLSTCSIYLRKLCETICDSVEPVQEAEEA